MKYFLDFTFKLDEKVNKANLRKKYQEEVLDMFRPYVEKKLVPPSLKSRPPHLNSSFNQQESSLNKLTSSDRHLGLESPTVRRLRERADTIITKNRKNESVNVKNGHMMDLVPT